MKKFTVAVFNSREKAEEAINALHTEASIPSEEISYAYKNTEGEVREVNLEETGEETDVSGGAASGAVLGGSIGAIAGLATAAGIIPVIGPLFAAGPLISALGLGAGALGSAAAGGVTGAAAGGIIGALTAWGVDETKAKEYEDQVTAGNVLLTVHADDTKDLVPLLGRCGATDVNVYSVR